MNREWNRSGRGRGNKARVTLNVEQLESRTVLTAGINETFVASLYQGVLGRNVDQAGLSYWAAALNTGTMTRTDVATGIYASEAAQAQDVQKLYQRSLDRIADPAGVSFWTQLRQAGAPREQAVAGIVGSDEFFRQAGSTNDGFLNSLYQKELNRTVDAAGKSFFGTRLAQGVSRTDVAQQFLNSQEAAAMTTQEVYANLLAHDPDKAGLDFYVPKIGETHSFDSVAGAVAGSDEFTLSISLHLAGTNTDDPNAAAAAINRQTGKFSGFLKSHGQPVFQVHPDPKLEPLVLSSTASNRSPTKLLEFTNTGTAGSLVHYKVTGSVTGPSGIIPLHLPSNAEGMLGKDLSAAIQVGVNAAGLPKGIYDGSLTVTDVDGLAGSVTVPVKLAVDSEVVITPPVIGTGGTFTTTQPAITPATPIAGGSGDSTGTGQGQPAPTGGGTGGTTGTSQGQPAITVSPAQSPLVLAASTSTLKPTANLTVTNSGPAGSVLHYTVSGSIDGPSGSLPLTLSSNATGTLASNLSAVVTVGVQISGVAAGTYTGTLAIADSDGVGSKTVPVKLTVSDGGFVGTYTGTYQGTGSDGRQLSGNLTVKITSATVGLGGATGYVIAGTIQATNFYGQTLSVSFGSDSGSSGHINNNHDGLAIDSDPTKKPFIELVGSHGAAYAAISGSAGHYQITGGLRMSDAQGNYALAGSPFTLTQTA